MLDAAEAVRYAQSIAQQATFTPRRWPLEVIANADASAAVALGADLPPSAAQGTLASAGGGGGALGPLWLLGLTVSVAAVARAFRTRT
jgi:hypothetical protein